MMREPLISLDRALELTRKDSADLFARHVNPQEYKLLKLGDMDKLYRKAEGCYIYDDRGEKYFDLTAGFGALDLGHNNPEVLEAVRRAASLPSVLLVGFNQLQGALAHNLAQLLPGGLTVTSFGSGGAEAVEHALKTARASTRRKKFVSCDKAYHGVSLGAMSVCGTCEHSETFGPLLESCERVPFGDLTALENKIKGRDVAAFIVEPVQGEGGMRVPPDGYLKGAQELCRKYDTLLVVDEIQTGFGRTGKLFAIDHEKVEPDIITLSKSLGGGVIPISASVTTDEIWKKAFGERDKFAAVVSTFGGNSMACAAALKAMEITTRDDLPAKADELGRHALKRLAELVSQHKMVKNVRGKGLLIGVELDPPGIPGADMDNNLSALVVSTLAADHRIITSFCDLDTKVVRFEPPLIATKQEIDTAIEAYDDVMGRGTTRLTLSFGKAFLSRKIKPG